MHVVFEKALNHVIGYTAVKFRRCDYIISNNVFIRGETFNKPDIPEALVVVAVGVDVAANKPV